MYHSHPHKNAIKHKNMDPHYIFYNPVYPFQNNLPKNLKNLPYLEFKLLSQKTSMIMRWLANIVDCKLY